MRFAGRTLVSCAAMVLLAAAPHARAAEKPSPLLLADEGSFFVNGQTISTEFPAAGNGVEPGHIVVNQMYVQYRIPARRAARALPLVMVPAGFHTGMEYETTPDGRMGWSGFFLRQGRPTYVVDQAGRARSGFDPTKFNQARTQSNAALDPGVGAITEERVWAQFRLGSAFGKPYPDSQFPFEAADAYYAELVPMTDVSAGNDTPKALASLVDKIGPAIVLAHSQSGNFGLQAAELRPDRVKAVVLIEPSNCGVTQDKIGSVWAHIPVLSIWGDHIDADPARGRQRDQCQALTDSINKAGGHATLISLPGMGIHGNGHIMTVEKNNLQIAALVKDWLDKLPD